MAQSDADNVRARYAGSDRADDAVRALRAEGVSPQDIRVGDPADHRHMLERQQRAEMEAAVPIIGGGFFTPGQAWGSFKWGLASVVAGAVVVGAFGFFFQIGTWSTWVSVAVLAFIGALAFGSAGFVYGGGREPELNGEVRANTADVTVAVEPRNRESRARAARTLHRTGARDVEAT